MLRVRHVDEVVVVFHAQLCIWAQGEVEQDEVGLGSYDHGRPLEIGGCGAGKVDAEVGDVGRAGDGDGHLDEFAGAHHGIGEGGVGATGVEETAWGIMALALGEGPWHLIDR